MYSLHPSKFDYPMTFTKPINRITYTEDITIVLDFNGCT